MLKIVANVNKQDVTYSYTVGQSFPKVEGKLISVELGGRELGKLLEKQEIPLCSVDNASLTWHGKHAGRVLKTLRELFDK